MQLNPINPEAFKKEIDKTCVCSMNTQFLSSKNTIESFSQNKSSSCGEMISSFIGAIKKFFVSIFQNLCCFKNLKQKDTEEQKGKKKKLEEIGSDKEVDSDEEIETQEITLKDAPLRRTDFRDLVDQKLAVALTDIINDISQSPLYKENEISANFSVHINEETGLFYSCVLNSSTISNFVSKSLDVFRFSISVSNVLKFVAVCTFSHDTFEKKYSIRIINQHGALGFGIGTEFRDKTAELPEDFKI